MVNYHENLITVHIKKKNQYVEPLKMLGEFIETDWRGEMSGSFDVEQLLVDNLQVLGTPLTGAVKKKRKEEEHNKPNKTKYSNFASTLNLL